MAVSITVPDTPWSSQLVSLSGKSYEFELTYNSRSSRWYLTISLSGVNIINSLKVIEGVDMTGRYLISEFSDGRLYCGQSRKTSDPVGRDNFGVGKDYGLVYLTNEEIIALG